MARSSTRFSAALLLGSAIALAFAASPASAQRQGPFSGLGGVWTGPGTISLNTGAKERIRCRAQYQADGGGSELKLELRCASDSYKFELQSSLSSNEGNISGTWSEVTRGAIGGISGNSSGNLINLRASSPVFSANLAVTTRGNQQSISIQSPGSEISSVVVTLNRGGK